MTTAYLFDQEAYHNYSSIYLPVTYALSYAIQFASMTALLTHTACYHGKTVWRQMRSSAAHGRPSWSTPKAGHPDDYARMGRSGSTDPLLDRGIDAVSVATTPVSDIPLIWYLVVGVISMFTGMFVVELYVVRSQPKIMLLT